VFLEPGQVIPAQKSNQKIAAIGLRQAVPNAPDAAVEYSVERPNWLPDLIHIRQTMMIAVEVTIPVIVDMHD
jgi:hypothetical protein